MWIRSLCFLTALMILPPCGHGASSSPAPRQSVVGGNARSRPPLYRAGPLRFVRLSSAAGDLPVPGPGKQQTACVVGQFDGHGGADFVIAERTASPAIVLYRLVGDRWHRSVVEPDALRLEAGGTAFDVDGDGDEDLVLGGDGSFEKLFWWENPGPERVARRWRRHVIRTGPAPKYHDQAAGDFDGDGRIELAFWNQRARALLLARVPQKSPWRPWPERVLYRWSSGERECEGLVAADVDRDGLVDLVGAGMWFRSLGGGRFEREVLAPQARFTRAAAGDIVPGGRLECLFVPGDANGPLELYVWREGSWQRQVLVERMVHAHSLQVADIDGDGDADIFAAEMGRWGRAGRNDRARMLIFLNDGTGRLQRHLLAEGVGNHESKLADVNGDGLVDIVVKPYAWRTPRIEVWLQQRP